KTASSLCVRQVIVHFSSAGWDDESFIIFGNSQKTCHVFKFFRCCIGFFQQFTLSELINASDGFSTHKYPHGGQFKQYFADDFRIISRQNGSEVFNWDQRLIDSRKIAVTA